MSVYRTIGPLVSSLEPKMAMLCRPSTISKIFSSETGWPVKAKLHVEYPWDGRTKLYINFPGQMTKMADMAINSKKPPERL